MFLLTNHPPPHPRTWTSTQCRPSKGGGLNLSPFLGGTPPKKGLKFNPLLPILGGTLYEGRWVGDGGIFSI